MTKLRGLTFHSIAPTATWKYPMPSETATEFLLEPAQEAKTPEAGGALPRSGAETAAQALPEQTRRFPGLELACTAFTRKQLLQPEQPQIAVAGRSNVGKSSLINALAGRRNLAKTSATPGKTRSINYYRLRGADSYVVDVPGYGYARSSQAEQEKWAELLRYYFKNTPGLRALLLLLDARLPPQKADKELLAYAAGLGLPVLAVLTKADKCAKRELAATLRAWEALIGKGDILVSSAKTRQGMEALGERILKTLGTVGNALADPCTAKERASGDAGLRHA
jgi:GTP-binding protein